MRPALAAHWLASSMNSSIMHSEVAAAALDDVHAAAVLIDDELGFVGLNVHAAAVLAQHQTRLRYSSSMMGSCSSTSAYLLSGRSESPDRSVRGLVGFNRLGSFSGHGFQQGVISLYTPLDAAADDGLDEAVARMLPCSSRRIRQEKAKRSSCGFSEQMPLDSWVGSMGMTLSA